MAKLICLPHAGGSASAYHSWLARLAPHDVIAVELPGRGRRFGQPLLRDIDSIAELVMQEHREVLEGDYVLFGHSMGAVVAYEIACRILCETRSGPKHLVVSASAAPLPRRTKTGLLTKATDATLIRRLESLDGLTPGVFSDRDVREVFLPPLRADLEALEGYEPPAGFVVLDTPITVLGGTDDVEVIPEHLPAWQEFTSRGFALHLQAGGHFYLRDREADVIRLLRDILET